MRLGVIADVHGNTPALEAALAELDEHSVGAIACLGDIVGILESPESVSLVRSYADYAATATTVQECSTIGVPATA